MVVRDALEGLLYPVVLPGVLHTQHMEQQIQVRPQLVSVGEGDLGGGEGEGWGESRCGVGRVQVWEGRRGK